ncbi:MULTISPECIES: DNA recombination protein RmuC [Leptotrichia]|jgi:rmuC family protein|uniref:DNA recombination protein RmuC n=1 Tax=Leptotrichia TaxID=32067 RepID=UPI0003AE3054|nr:MULTISPECIES: DNA recombination protein RmuC [Leptotrichia]ERL26883.1 RmuC domain protein [Leptotrichia sp. oral taxon 225 str. F0581]WLD73956.1 DNA recombination protein RmuC [Leptotrichia sp. HMT-225]
MITVVIIIVIINIVTVVGTIIFLNKKNIENEEKMLLNQINENNQQNFEENKKKFDEIEKTISLNAKNNLLEGINNLQNKLSENNEKLLLRFNQLGQNLSGTMNDNNQLLSKNHTENSQLLTSSMNNNIQKLSVRLNENNTALTGVMTENNQNLTKNINEFKDGLTKNINENFEKLSQKIENRLDVMNMKVEERLSKGFEETTKTFGNVLERLSKIDEAQKKIEALSSNVVSLQDILTDKKSRGIFGEIQLYQILSSVFGEKNDKLYQKQYKLSNGTIVDSIIFTPEPLGNIAVDSKFPLENYRKMYNNDLSQIERENARKDFVSDLKKHIDAISSKYIIKNETSEQAILFLPAEAIFAEINAYHTDIIEYAYKKNVRIASPTTLISVLTVIQVMMTNLERDKYANIIQQELEKLNVEFTRYRTRWDNLQKDIEKVSKDVKEINTTSNKISKRFTEISNAKFEEKTVNNNVENLKILEMEE